MIYIYTEFIYFIIKFIYKLYNIYITNGKSLGLWIKAVNVIKAINI